MIEIKTVTDYLNNDYREYAIYVVEDRAIPSVIDGFKPSQRKVIFVADKVWKNGSEKPLKIYQLSGKVATESHYHHGDSSVNSTIIGMAQKFKNSVPLLDEIGQFGSLRSPDAGAPRYISTKLNKNFRLLYMDFELLRSKQDEGEDIEPYYFLPIIPTVLLNGGSGIAVGFATNVLNRNPIDLINACIAALEEKSIKEPGPWYNGFSGTVEKLEDSKSWLFRGKYEVKNTSTVVINELPPSMTYEKFDAYLSRLEDSRQIISYENNCKSNINYTIKFKREDLKTLIDSDRLSKFLKMEEKESENFTTLDEFGNLKIFDNSIEIIKYFVKFRLAYYQKRKDYLIKKIENDLLILSNKSKFIKMIIDGTIKINNVSKKDIISSLSILGFIEINESYSYLLSLPIHTLTKETYEALLLEESKKLQDLENIKASQPQSMYKGDLIELKKALAKNY